MTGSAEVIVCSYQERKSSVADCSVGENISLKKECNLKIKYFLFNSSISHGRILIQKQNRLTVWTT